MGYLNNQNRQAVEDHIVKLMSQLRTVNLLTLNKKGVDALANAAFNHFDQLGNPPLFETLAGFVPQLREMNPTWRDDFPHEDDQQLAWLMSIDDYNDASADKIRRYLQPVAVDSGLHARFNDRVNWLRNNKLRRPKTPVAVAPPAAPLTPEQQVQADLRKRLDAVYAKIDKAGGPDWAQKTIQFRLWLRNKVKELIREGRGVSFIEAHIDSEIHDQEVGSIR